ncbi:MAG: cation-translocating P-type ATPase family protein [Isosphaeraceae bacterium]
MHREFRPEDMRPFEDDPFRSSGQNEMGAGSRGLLTLTIAIGMLLGVDLLAQWLGPIEWRPRASWLTLAAAILGATYIVHGALASLLEGRIGADLALAQACIAALVLGQPFVAAEVVFIALVGEVLESVTFARTRRALGRLVEQTPRTARVRREGAEIEVPVHEVVVGDLVIVGPGERIPVDGPIQAGRSTVDQSTLTGESIPVDRGPSDQVYTGTLNQFGRIEVRAQKVGAETTFGQVVRMVRQARGRKAELERVADRLARYFLPAVEIAAGLTLLAGYLRGWPDVWSRAVAVLVVACPCALVLATPAAMLASMAWLARHGILIKGGYALERLAACDTFAFDKTGTLTEGNPRLSSLTAAAGRGEEEVLSLAAAAERASRHPLAIAVAREAAGRGLEVPEVRDARILPGAGVQATLALPADGATQVLVGNVRLMAEQRVALDEHALAALGKLEGQGETPLIVASDGAVVGWIGLRDQVRAEAHDVVDDLRHLGITELALLTGDREAVAWRVAKEVHLRTVLAALLPAGKAAWVKEQQAAGRRVAMVGDGINDAPALAQADAGIALGGVGADLAAEAGDLIVLGDPLRKLPELVELSRATVRVIRQNIIGFAFGLNATAVILAALGILSPVAAAILHQIGSLLVLLNAMRLLSFGGWSELPPVRWLRAAGERIGRADEALDLERARRWCLHHARLLTAVGLAAFALAYLASGIVRIGPGQVGVLRRFGGYRGELRPGLHLRLPPPLESVTTVEPALVRSLSLGFRGQSPSQEPVRWESGHGRSRAGTEDESNALLVTGDGQFLEITASLQYAVDPERPDAIRRFALGVDDPERALAVLAESAVREVVARGPLLDLLTSGRREAEESSARLLRRKTGALDIGVAIHALTFQDVHPPLAVLDSYRDVSRAESDRERRANEAAAYRVERLADAEARAAALVDAAEARRERQVALAGSGADAFGYRLAAREGARAITDFRLFWEAIGRVLPGRPKLILEASSPRPQRLIIPGLPPALAAAAAASDAVPPVGPPAAPASGGTPR